VLGDPSLLVSNLISLSKSFCDHAATLGVLSGICKLGASSASACSICGAAAEESRKKSSKNQTKELNNFIKNIYMCVSWFLKPAELMPKIILIGEPAVLSC
jgi:hypothetical protein